MQSKDGINGNNLQQPNGICQRLYNFITNTLFSPPFKRITMSQTSNSDIDHQILLQDLSKIGEESGVISSEIVVESRHTEDWTSAVNNHNAVILSDAKQKENDQIARIGIMKPQVPQVQEKSAGEFEVTSTNVIKGKSPKKIVSIKDDQKDRDKQQEQKDKDIPATVPRGESEFVRKSKLPRLSNVTSNINEKSDAFIKSRKKGYEKEFHS